MNNTMIENDKAEKLLHYASRDLTKFVQMDCFLKAVEDSFVHPDEDGDALFATETEELMTGIANVRVLIIPGTKPEDVKRILCKFADWYLNENGFGHFEQ